ncbi:MAG: DHH family phosphoesterase [Lachnospiraceae bacterium]|nr:DHH family phosphoesterase [Lachnospiraceae bacterium]
MSKHTLTLSELLKYDDIVIQCHDNPDADALASGFALQWFFRKKGKDARFIYRGSKKIRKSNLVIMVNELGIPVNYEPDYAHKPELLITVDSQYGQRNITTTPAETVAVIDHHQVSDKLPHLSEVRSNMGSCSTIIWDMIRDEKEDISQDMNLQTALYYGLYSDTNRLAELSNPLDRDMIEALSIRESVVKLMNNSNISLAELEITGHAIIGYEYIESDKCMILQAEPCDPNILGVISDFSLETENVDVCVAYYVTPEEVKFSVRSCVREVHANELAGFIAENIGGGGGHMYKAGGVIHPEKLPGLGSEDPEAYVSRFVRERLHAYYDRYEIIYASTEEADITGMRRYGKIPVEMGTVKLTDMYPVGSLVDIRTMEGDIQVKIEEDTYLMIGIEGEVYPIDRKKMERTYKFLDHPYSHEFEYEPSIKLTQGGERKAVIPYAKAVISTGQSFIYARPVDKYIKVFTKWDEENYYAGEPGDYLAVREEDLSDIYRIQKDLFPRLYKEEPLK